MKSDRTKQCKKLVILFSILHFLFLFGPMLYFIPYAFITSEPGNKLVLSIFLIAGACLSLVAIFTDVKHRSGLTKTMMWVLIIGISICLQEIETFVYIMAIVSIIDELVIVRLKEKYKVALAANKEIDRRS